MVYMDYYLTDTAEQEAPQAVPGRIRRVARLFGPDGRGDVGGVVSAETSAVPARRPGRRIAGKRSAL